MLCDYIQQLDGTFLCSVCGDKAKRLTRRHCGKPSIHNTGDCQLRGSDLRLQECDTCTGKQRIKVFACVLHRECTIGKKLPGIACCAPGQCADYVPSIGP